MTRRRPWVRGGLPFLRSGPLWRVHTKALPRLDEFVAQHGYRRIELDGRRMTSRDAAHAELKRAFELPEWCGANWDAFDDGLGHFVSAHDGELVAVVWLHADEAARLAPATAVEVGWALLLCTTGGMPSLPTRSTLHVDLDVFAVGDGPDFDGPDGDDPDAPAHEDDGS
ncbi:barstar family protein [Terracoccus luteus]|uniref:RNAse (Barnase) inhibitor barstar n=1 Tax=Terracoccus luteus TaxID=53356 RepID=A0A839PWY9_9MICO|nr:barstar family protein [Terracoccus luteus]MBB2985312.1 RNAse (barnase) inhibitor barstar [Terracoccus luteus]MCP2170964.1 RNAse (barnase) inhibitor barstar [Terracoccus luteus]